MSDGPDEGVAPSVLARRRRVLWLALAGSVATSLVGFAAGYLVKSPQQLAAETQAPPAGPVTALVERRELTHLVVLRGTVVAAQTLEVTPAPSSGRAVVTAIRASAGATVLAGQIIVEVSGRPLFVLPGTVPAYRDLRPGAEGADVAQMQSALRGLGFASGTDRIGLFGEGTKQAVRRFYGSIGFAVPTTGDGDARALAAAEDAVSAAERALADAQDALAAVRSGQDPLAVRAAERAVEFAQRDLDRARRAHAELRHTTGPMMPLAEHVFVASLPVRVEKVNGDVGTVVSGPLLTLSSGTLVVRARVSPADRDLVRSDLVVIITSEVLGVTARARVESIGELSRDESGRSGYPMVVVPTESLAPTMSSQDVRLSVEAERTPGEVLVVPLASVSTGADGRTTVTKMAEAGVEERIEVVAGLSGGGFVEIRPVAGGLAAGDRVVVGR